MRTEPWTEGEKSGGLGGGGVGGGCGEGVDIKKKKLQRSLYLHRSPGVHYPGNITHAQTALFGVLMLIQLLNDVESLQTNGVWWLNDMDFQQGALLKG